jgi:type II secretory pathway pseudopilin PulG
MFHFFQGNGYIIHTVSVVSECNLKSRDFQKSSFSTVTFPLKLPVTSNIEFQHKFPTMINDEINDLESDATSTVIGIPGDVAEISNLENNQAENIPDLEDPFGHSTSLHDESVLTVSEEGIHEENSHYESKIDLSSTGGAYEETIEDPILRPVDRPVSAPEKKEKHVTIRTTTPKTKSRASSPPQSAPRTIIQTSSAPKHNHGSVWKPGFKNRRSDSDYLKHSFPAGFSLARSKNKIYGGIQFYPSGEPIVLSPSDKFSFHDWTKGGDDRHHNNNHHMDDNNDRGYYDDEDDEEDDGHHHHGDPYLDVAGPLLRDLHQARINMGIQQSDQIENDPACMVSRAPVITIREVEQLKKNKNNLSRGSTGRVFHAPSALPSLPVAPALVKPYSEKDGSEAAAWIPVSGGNLSIHQHQSSIHSNSRNSGSRQPSVSHHSQQLQNSQLFQPFSSIHSGGDNHSLGQISFNSVTAPSYAEWLTTKRMNVDEKVWKQKGNDFSYNYSIHSFDGQPSLLSSHSKPMIVRSPFELIPTPLPSTISLEIYTVDSLQSVTEQSFQNYSCSSMKFISPEQGITELKNEISLDIVKNIELTFFPPLNSLIKNHIDKVNAEKILEENAATLYYHNIDYNRISLQVYYFSPEEKIWKLIDSEVGWVQAKHACHLYALRLQEAQRQKQLKQQQQQQLSQRHLLQQQQQQSSFQHPINPLLPQVSTPNSHRSGGTNSRLPTGRLVTPVVHHLPTSALQPPLRPTSSSASVPPQQEGSVERGSQKHQQQQSNLNSSSSVMTSSDGFTIKLMYAIESSAEAYLQGQLDKNYAIRKQILEKDRINMSLEDLTSALEKESRRKRKKNRPLLLQNNQLSSSQGLGASASLGSLPVDLQNPSIVTGGESTVLSTTGELHQSQSQQHENWKKKSLKKPLLKKGKSSSSHQELLMMNDSSVLDNNNNPPFDMFKNSHLLQSSSTVLPPSQQQQTVARVTGGITAQLEEDAMKRKINKGKTGGTTVLMSSHASILYPQQSLQLKKLQEESQKQIPRLQSFAEQLQDRLLKTKF